MIATKRVGSVAELVLAVSEFQEESGHKSILWFRGHKSSDWHLQPGVFRTSTFASQERNFVHRFRSRAGIRYKDAPEYNDFARWLSLMQHFGLPTRLLDWSRSPLVAAYFAVESLVERGELPPESPAAAIWVLYPIILNELGGFDPITPSIEARMVAEVLEPAFLSDAEEKEQVVAVMASEHDPRMFVQQGCFTLHSDKNELDLKPSAEEFLMKIEIPKKFLLDFSKEIRICGFRQGDIYPDLDHLAAELVAEFGKRR